MVIARHHQHAAIWGGAIGVGVFERIAGAVHTGAFAVPQADHTIDGAAGMALHLLGAIDGGGGEILVHGGEEFDVMLAQQRRDFPRLQIDPRHRRATIPRDHARRVQPGPAVPPRLIEHDTDNRLGAAEKHPPVLAGVAIHQGVFGIQDCAVLDGIHRHSPVAYGDSMGRVRCEFLPIASDLRDFAVKISVIC